MENVGTNINFGIKLVIAVEGHMSDFECVRVEAASVRMRLSLNA